MRKRASDWTWKRLPDARLVMIEGSGHLPHVEKAEPVGRAVREFLKGAAR